MKNIIFEHLKEDITLKQLHNLTVNYKSNIQRHK